MECTLASGKSVCHLHFMWIFWRKSLVFSLCVLTMAKVSNTHNVLRKMSGMSCCIFGVLSFAANMRTGTHTKQTQGINKIR